MKHSRGPWTVDPELQLLDSEGQLIAVVISVKDKDVLEQAPAMARLILRLSYLGAGENLADLVTDAKLKRERLR